MLLENILSLTTPCLFLQTNFIHSKWDGLRTESSIYMRSKRIYRILDMIDIEIRPSDHLLAITRFYTKNKFEHE